jgi:hypothetical protein
MISDRTAQHIASLWHGGGGSPLHQFASTGTIHNLVIQEVHNNIDGELHEFVGYGEKERVRNVKELTRLLEYLVLKGHREPQQGWYENVISRQGEG